MREGREGREGRESGTGRVRELFRSREDVQREKEEGKRRWVEHTVSEYRELIYGKGSRYIDASMSRLQMPLKHSDKILEWFNKSSTFLYVYGKPGTGKSYFCSAFMEKVVERYEKNFRYWREADLLDRLRAYIGDGRNYSTELKYMIDYPCLMLDDLGSTGVSNTTWRQEVMFDLVDQLYTKQTPTIITGNIGKEEIREIYGERFQSRIFAKENTIICTDGWPDFRESGY